VPLPGATVDGAATARADPTPVPAPSPAAPASAPADPAPAALTGRAAGRDVVALAARPR
jgi:hypothetical protein